MLAACSKRLAQVGGPRMDDDEVAVTCDTYLHVMHPVRVLGLQALIRLLLGSTGIGTIGGDY